MVHSVGDWDMGHGTLGWTHLTPHLVAHIANVGREEVAETQPTHYTLQGSFLH